MRNTGKGVFGSVLHQIAKDNGMTLAELGKAAGIDDTIISKWKSSRWGTIPEKTFADVVAAACRTSEQRVALYMAYTMAMLPKEAQPFVEITPKAFMKKQEDMRGLVGTWGAELRVKLQRIGDAFGKDRDFDRMFNSLAGWAKSVNTSDGK
tara:strand:- start:2677 stop:3129 length:453 start_codon:yes stop_codon:yes gene_type:complete